MQEAFSFRSLFTVSNWLLFPSHFYDIYIQVAESAKRLLEQASNGNDSGAMLNDSCWWAQDTIALCSFPHFPLQLLWMKIGSLKLKTEIENYQFSNKLFKFYGTLYSFLYKNWRVIPFFPLTYTLGGIFNFADDVRVHHGHILRYGLKYPNILD